MIKDSTPLEFELEAALQTYSKSQIAEMLAAGEVLNEYLAILKKSGQNMVGQCLANQGTFFEQDHYPKGDVYDPASHAQYYYHAHRPETGEHGHFHTFLRSAGMAKNVRPRPYKGSAKRPKGKEALAHIVAVSMDKPGFPMSLFTTNQWVTGETFYRAEDVIAMIDRFTIELSYPCLATNRGLTAMLQFFKPQIVGLLQLRDSVVQQWAHENPSKDVYEDRDLEITSIIDVTIESQLAALKKHS